MSPLKEAPVSPPEVESCESSKLSHQNLDRPVCNEQRYPLPPSAGDRERRRWLGGCDGSNKAYLPSRPRTTAGPIRRSKASLFTKGRLKRRRCIHATRGPAPIRPLLTRYIGSEDRRFEVGTEAHVMASDAIQSDVVPASLCAIQCGFGPDGSKPGSRAPDAGDAVRSGE